MEISASMLVAPEAPFYSLVVGTAKMSIKSAKKCPIQISVPHPVYPSDYSVCLLVKDPQRLYKDQVERQEIKSVKRVIGVGKLSKKFRSYEAKRLLADQHDLFVADERILPLLPKSLGKAFLTRKSKIPVKMDMSRPADLKTNLDDILYQSTFLYLGQGTCLNVKVGIVGQSIEQIVENVMAAIKGVGGKIPGKDENIQSLHLKLPNSVSLPLYSTLPEHEE